MHIVKGYVINVMWGVALTATTMLIPYQYCMDGAGRGFPFAVYCPSCGAWLPAFAFDDSKIPQILDLGGFLVDVLVWGLAAAFVRYRLSRPRVLSPGTTEA
ncbi:MAG: hypothetical protein U1G08_16710 [Verrucomicrobiota bacterium]